MDDVLLFGEGTFEEWYMYKSILDTFCRDSQMAISESKSSFLESRLDEGTLVQLKNLFPFEVKYLDVVFKYLG